MDGKTAGDVFDETLAPLADAACRGDFGGISRSLDRGASPNASGSGGVTPLAWAVSCDNVNGVQALLEAGADPNKPIGKEYSSVLYIAVGRDDPGVLKALLNAGADPNVYDLKSERTGLTEALSRGIHTNDWRHWEMLLEKADINRPYNKLGKTIAIYAANFNQFQRVVQLLEKGYSYRLRTLGRAVEIAMPLDEPSATWKNKTIEMLQDRGVDFPIGPVPPEVIFEGDLQMLPPSLR